MPVSSYVMVMFNNASDYRANGLTIGLYWMD